MKKFVTAGTDTQQILLKDMKWVLGEAAEIVSNELGINLSIVYKDTSPAWRAATQSPDSDPPKERVVNPKDKAAVYVRKTDNRGVLENSFTFELALPRSLDEGTIEHFYNRVYYGVEKRAQFV